MVCFKVSRVLQPEQSTTHLGTGTKDHTLRDAIHHVWITRFANPNNLAPLDPYVRLDMPSARTR
jgi:hypothetical protein